MTVRQFIPLLTVSLSLCLALIATQKSLHSPSPENTSFDEKIVDDRLEELEWLASFYKPTPTAWLTLTDTNEFADGVTYSAFLVPFFPESNDPEQWRKLCQELKYDPRKSNRTFTVEKRNFLLGEPIIVRYQVETEGDGTWVRKDWDYYNNRDNSFIFRLRNSSGQWVADRYSPKDSYHGGGSIVVIEYSRDYPETHRFAIQQYCAVTEPGDYDLYCFRLSTRVRKSNNFPSSPLLKAVPAAALETATISPFVEEEMVKDFAKFKISIRKSSDQEHQTMIDEYSRFVLEGEQHLPRYERESAVVLAWEHSMFSDFVPALYEWSEQYRNTLKYDYAQFWMSDETDGWRYETLSAKSAAQEIPLHISDLTSPEASKRTLAEFHLRRWTGNSINHTWIGHQEGRPTLDEGKRMQKIWNFWWNENGETLTYGETSVEDEDQQ